jgi:hypothetical protein
MNTIFYNKEDIMIRIIFTVIIMKTFQSSLQKLLIGVQKFVSTFRDSVTWFSITDKNTETVFVPVKNRSLFTKSKNT